MRLARDRPLIAQYRSGSQQSRVLTEGWVAREGYCPQCGAHLAHYENNRPVADFFCAHCAEDYELKGTKKSIGKKVIAAQYDVLLQRLQGNHVPNLFLLHYDVHLWEVRNFVVIPQHFFVPSIVERRKPLPQTARRAGFIGSYILIHHIPESGRIFYIKNGKVAPRAIVLRNWQKTLFLRKEHVATKGWLVDIMRCIDEIGKKEFVLDDLYAYASYLHTQHPHSQFIKEKIRQQLQILRDNGYIEFVARGRYRVTY